MGNAMFHFGSAMLDKLGYGDKMNAEHVHVPGEVDDNDDHVDKHDRVVHKNIVEMEHYCKPLIFINFKGQASGEDTDSNKGGETFNIGVLLQELDIHIRQYSDLSKFSCEEENLVAILAKIADKRHRGEEPEKKCLKRLIRDAKRFEKIYKERASANPEQQLSEPLHHEDYWGTRQQLLSAKVICDWLCEEDQPPMDPIFGVLLNPTAGRVGPGDSSWVHSILYDNCGEWAHHSAVHDAFGYLFNFHKVGPGYNYMYRSFFDKDNPLAGQISGIEFWKLYVKEIETKLKVVENFKDI